MIVTYCNVDDNPTKQQVGREILDMDIVFLHLKEIDDDDIEPRYEMFGEGAPLCRDHADIGARWNINNDCDGYHIDCCDEWRFGQYCVSAVQRYWDENNYTATVKDAYIHFVAHYNRVLDWHSYGDGHTHKLRSTQITKPPHCMRMGSLRFALQWIKYKIENGPEKDWYVEQRRKRKLERMTKEAERKLCNNEFKPKSRNYMYRRSKK